MERRASVLCGCIAKPTKLKVLRTAYLYAVFECISKPRQLLRIQEHEVGKKPIRGHGNTAFCHFLNLSLLTMGTQKWRKMENIRWRHMT